MELFDLTFRKWVYRTSVEGFWLPVLLRLRVPFKIVAVCEAVCEAVSSCTPLCSAGSPAAASPPMSRAQSAGSKSASVELPAFDFRFFFFFFFISASP